MENDNEHINGGCILLSRNILNSDIWLKPPEYLKIFLYILLKVNHKDGLFPRGSNFFNFAEEKISGVSLSQIYNFLRWAKSGNSPILATQKTTRGTILKVNNYEHYQNIKNYFLQDTLQDSYKIATRQLQDSYKMINKNERMKECKNVISSIGEKKEKKVFSKRKNKNFIPPTLEEVKAYCEERQNNVDPQKFFDYYSSGNWTDGNGKPLKNWKQKIIAVWEKSKSGNSAPQQKISEQESFYMSLSRY